IPPRSTSSCVLWPTSLMKNRSGPVLGSNAKRNGLRRPHAYSSWHGVGGVDGRLPRTRQLAVPGPLIGLPGAGSPVDGTTRRILPCNRLRSSAASLGLESARGSAPASPTEMYRNPSPPISRSPPLWLPAFDEMLSTRITSLLGSMLSPVIVNRLARFTQPPGAAAGWVKYRYTNPLALKS